MTEEPTTGEIVRRLDALTTQIGELVSELKADRAEAAKTYMRRDVYIAERQAANAVVSDLQTDISTVKQDLDREVSSLHRDRKDEAASRRQIWLALGGLAVTSLLGLAALVVNIMQR